MLHEFVTRNRQGIISRCRANVAARSIPNSHEAETDDHGVPLFLDQLVEALRSGKANTSAIDRTAGQHGHDLLLKGFTVSQVVQDYGDVCQTITELALDTNSPIGTEDFRTLNRCLDEAIAGAVTLYHRESQQSHVDEAGAQSNERMGFFAHELRNLVNTATVAFAVLKTGNVGPTGSTGAVLDRSLAGLRELIARSLDEVRVTHGAADRKRLVVAEFIAEVGDAATLAAREGGITLIVVPVPEELAIEADQSILAAVMGNLLQNAFKFTRPHSTVTLSVNASADRVAIEVEDECGGLPGEDVTNLFRPFEQQDANRTGLGLGLAFSRWGAEANGGRLSVRNLPGKGCVFTVDLPATA